MNKIFLNSLPKSGTHLLVKLLKMMGLEFSKLNLSSSTIYGRHSFYKSIIRGPAFGQPSIEVGLDISTAARQSWITNSLNKVENGSFCSGHAPYSDSLHSIVIKNGLKTINTIRDPRDVLVSWAHYVPKTHWHYGRDGLKNLSLEKRVEKILYGYQSGEFLIESFINILRRSSEWIVKDDVLTVHFEDLVGSKGGGNEQSQLLWIDKVGEYAGVESFNSKILSETLFGGTKVFRKGKIGSYIEELPRNLIDEVDEVLKEYILKLGYIHGV